MKDIPELVDSLGSDESLPDSKVKDGFRYSNGRGLAQLSVKFATQFNTVQRSRKSSIHRVDGSL
jgi:hypothetical protein